MHKQTAIRWHSYQKFYFISLLGATLLAASITQSLGGDLKAGMVSIIGLLMLISSCVAIMRKGVWVEINELGITYRNLFGTKSLKWKDISHSYTITIKLVATVCVKRINGKSVTGSKAQVISDTINSRLNNVTQIH